MTSTPVSNDVTSLLLNVTSQSVQKERTDNNFSDVLQKQSQSPDPGDATAEKKQVTSRTKVEKSAEGKIKEETDVKAEAIRTVNEEAETLGISEEEALSEAEKLAGQLLVQMAEGLGMSVEELQSLMNEMGMEPVDLLKGDGLMQLLLAAGGEKDSLSLLTNEELYAAFRELNKTLEEGLAKIQRETGMNPEDLRMLLEKVKSGEAQTGIETESADITEVKTENKSVTNPGVNEVQNTGEKDTTAVVQESGQKGSAKGNENSFANNPQGVFVQNAELLQNLSNATSAIPTEGYFSAETELIMNQIVDFMKVHVGDGLSQLEMQLHPENLGTLQIHVASKDGVITAHFMTENEVVKEALESQMIQLKDAFKEQGIKVEAIEVTVQTNGFEKNLEQGRQDRSDANNSEQPKMRVRRLHLTEPGDPEEELLDESDKLAAEMMAENGNTVDYTV